MKHAFLAFLILAFITVIPAQAQRGDGGGGRGRGGGRGGRPASTMDSTPKEFQTQDYKIRVVTIAEQLVHPYSLAFLPDGSMLVAESEGRLRLIRDGKLVPEPITGVPQVHFAAGQAGLMDIAIHPSFVQNKFVYFSYNKPGEKGSTMAVARGAYDGKQLTGIRDIFVADAWGTANGHLSSRIAFGRDGMLYMTIADHNMIPEAGMGNQHAGKIVRLRDDGTVPPDNPFVGKAGYMPEIWTIGHRNPHSLVINPATGDFWSVEHGDEVNIIKRGGHYGWPFKSAGEGDPIGPPPAGVQLTDPYMQQFPVLNISGMMFYTGDKFPKWKGNLFVGGLASQQIHRVVLGPTAPSHRESIFINLGQRVRDLRQGPDGLIYFTTDDPSGRVMRVEPVQ